MRRLAFSLFLITLPASGNDGPRESFGVTVDPGEIIDQHLYPNSRSGCGPAAVANSLRFGKPEVQAVWHGLFGSTPGKKLRFVIDRYFLGRQSAVFPELKRFRREGVESEDLAAAYAEILDDNRQGSVRGRFLDRKEDESDQDFVARLHRGLEESLKAGVPPILGLRSFLAQRDPDKDAITGGKIAWKASRSHYVVVTGIPRTLPEGELGFGFELIDPNGGKLRSAFVYAEPHQPFVALKGNEQTGRWLSGKPFLVVQAPGVKSLQPRDAVWRDRVVITAHFLIGASLFPK